MQKREADTTEKNRKSQARRKQKMGVPCRIVPSQLGANVQTNQDDHEASTDNHERAGGLTRTI
jgi:hypothetical protein